MAKILYVIGNGFDMFHGIPSGYQNYAEWLYNTGNETLYEIHETFGDFDEDWWYRFEEHLADAEVVRIASETASEHVPDFASDDFRDRDWYDAEYAVESRLDEVYDDITDSFSEWVSELDLSECKVLLKFHKEDSLFLTFNYTETLEDVYGVDESQILHIHGRAKSGDKLVFGHGSTYEDIAKANPGPQGEDIEYWETRAYEGAVGAISKKKKAVYHFISINENFFRKLADVAVVITLGFSYSDTDSKYIDKICEMIDCANVRWIASAYSEEDRERVVRFFKDHGISNHTIIRDLSEVNGISLISSNSAD